MNENYYNVYLTRHHDEYARSSQCRYFVVADDLKLAIEAASQVDRSSVLSACTEDFAFKSTPGAINQIIVDSSVNDILDEHVWCNKVDIQTTTHNVYAGGVLKSDGREVKVVVATPKEDQVKLLFQRAARKLTDKLGMILEVCVDHRYKQGYLTDIAINIC